MKTIGFIGLGVMGQSLVHHLLQAGYNMVVYTRTPQKAQRVLQLPVKWANSPAEVAQQSDVVLTMVGYPEDVRAVYLGDNGLFQTARAGQLLIDLTTSTPALAQELYELGQQRGVWICDAPVSGGDIGARKGTLTVMVGCDASIYEQVETVLSVFASRVRRQGPAGAGQHTKMANQIMIAGTMLGLTELLVYAQSAGLTLSDVLDTLNAGSAANFSMATYGPRILANDYSPGFFAKHFLKDLSIALFEAERMGLDLPATRLAKQLYEQLVAAGHGDEGTQALIKLWHLAEFTTQ